MPIWFKKCKKIFLLEIGTKKINKDKARYPYDSLIKPDVDTLEKSKGRGKDKRNNILTILDNIETSVFDGVYFHYSSKPSEPEPKSEESIAKRIQLRKQLRKQRLNEITKKEEDKLWIVWKIFWLFKSKLYVRGFE